MKNHIFQIYSITSNTLFYMKKIVMKIFPKAIILQMLHYINCMNCFKTYIEIYVYTKNRLTIIKQNIIIEQYTGMIQNYIK